MSKDRYMAHAVRMIHVPIIEVDSIHFRVIGFMRGQEQVTPGGLNKWMPKDKLPKDLYLTEL